ncbi:MAG: hypothetical protein K6T31_06640 [Alicyclobacillus sp.]|nr:hypothetical protein [Alicyclobacillus sp.]
MVLLLLLAVLCTWLRRRAAVRWLFTCLAAVFWLAFCGLLGFVLGYHAGASGLTILKV